jgi:hypothetical protein
MTELDEFRAEKDEFFGSHPQSPLTREQKKVFMGCSIFLKMIPCGLEVKVEEFENKQSFEMQTSTGDIQIYEKFGKFRFEVDEEQEVDDLPESAWLFSSFCGYIGW